MTKYDSYFMIHHICWPIRYAAYRMHYISWILYQVYLCILMGQVMCFGMNLILKAKSTARDSHKDLVTVPFHSGLVQYLYLILLQHSHHTYTNEAHLWISDKTLDFFWPRVSIFESRTRPLGGAISKLASKFCHKIFVELDSEIICPGAWKPK